VSRDRGFLLSAGQDGRPRLWATRHATCLTSYRGHGHPVLSVAFAPHNAHFLTACYDGSLRMFATERRDPVRVMAGHLAEVSVGVFHPNGAYTLSASQDGTLRLWDVSMASCARLFCGHSAAVTAAAIAPDGATVASAGEDQTVRLWHVASGKQLLKLDLPESRNTAVCYNSTGRLLACLGERVATVWQVRELSDSSTEPWFSSPTGMPILGATFVPNQPVLVVGCVDDP